MITFICVPKAFRGHIGLIQRNAIASWTKLEPDADVILFGDEEGIAKEARTLGVRHVAEIAKNEFNTPLLNDVFSKAKKYARYDILCYVNADIILMSDFIKSAERIRSLIRDKFLMVGSRWNLEINKPIEFSGKWESEIRAKVREHGVQAPVHWIDYFLFSKNVYEEVPPLAIGRAGFDNWLVWKARAAGAAVVNASRMVYAVHQNHDYSHHPQGKNGVWNGMEAEQNRQLMGGWLHCYSLVDSTHLLTERGLIRNLSLDRLRGSMKRKWATFMIDSQPFRHRYGLHRYGFHDAFRWLGK